MVIGVSDMSLYLWLRWMLLLLLTWTHIMFRHLNRLILSLISHSNFYWCNLIIIKLWLWSGWTSWFRPLLFIHIHIVSHILPFFHTSTVRSWFTYVLRCSNFSRCSAIFTWRPICCHVVFLIFWHFWHALFCLKSRLIILLNLWVLIFYISNEKDD